MYHNQLLDLAALLGPSYGHVGVGRDDGKEAGEYSPIFYDRTKFEVVKWRTIWLSPTPDIPGSKGWDAVRHLPSALAEQAKLIGVSESDADSHPSLPAKRRLEAAHPRREHALRRSRDQSSSVQQSHDPRTHCPMG